MQHRSRSALLSEPDTHHSADTSWTLLILIREAIKFCCWNRDPDFELCWLEKYIMCWQDVYSVTTNKGWGECTRGGNVIHWIITVLYTTVHSESCDRESTQVTEIWLEFKELRLWCWYHSSILLWTSCLAWGLLESTSHGSAKAWDNAWL